MAYRACRLCSWDLSLMRPMYSWERLSDLYYHSAFEFPCYSCTGNSVLVPCWKTQSFWFLLPVYDLKVCSFSLHSNEIGVVPRCRYICIHILGWAFQCSDWCSGKLGTCCWFSLLVLSSWNHYLEFRYPVPLPSLSVYMCDRVSDPLDLEFQVVVNRMV